MKPSKVCFCWLLNRAKFKLNGFSVILLVFSDSEPIRSKFESLSKLFMKGGIGHSSSEIFL